MVMVTSSLVVHNVVAWLHMQVPGMLTACEYENQQHITGPLHHLQRCILTRERIKVALQLPSMITLPLPVVVDLNEHHTLCDEIAYMEPTYLLSENLLPVLQALVVCFKPP